MRGALFTFSWAVSLGWLTACAQTNGAETVEPKRLPGVSAPKPSAPSIASVPEKNTGRGFLKNFTIDSFGYGSAPVQSGFGSPGELTNGPFTTHGLECARCMVRPNMDRTRSTIPAFGTQATLAYWNGRAELFSGFGGINAWKPDNTVIEPWRRGTSYNDAWLAQGFAGARVAVDRERHLWLGPTLRHLQNFGEGKKHWNSVGGSATFTFGR
jgi:hypothetical protein